MSILKDVLNHPAVWWVIRIASKPPAQWANSHQITSPELMTTALQALLLENTWSAFYARRKEDSTLRPWAFKEKDDMSLYLFFSFLFYFCFYFRPHLVVLKNHYWLYVQGSILTELKGLFGYGGWGWTQVGCCARQALSLLYYNSSPWAVVSCFKKGLSCFSHMYMSHGVISNFLRKDSLTLFRWELWNSLITLSYMAPW